MSLQTLHPRPRPQATTMLPKHFDLKLILKINYRQLLGFLRFFIHSNVVSSDFKKFQTRVLQVYQSSQLRNAFELKYQAEGKMILLCWVSKSFG